MVECLGLFGRIDETCQSVCALSSEPKAHGGTSGPSRVTRKRMASLESLLMRHESVWVYVSI